MSLRVVVVRLQGRNPATGTHWHPRHKICRYGKRISQKRPGKFWHYHIEW